MNETELRSDLHNMIDKISDIKVLSAVKTLLSDKTDWWDSISEEERSEIEQGLAEDGEGEVLSHKEVMKKYKKWL